MSTIDDRLADARREEHEQRMEDHPGRPLKPCRCGGDGWKLTASTWYGEDADGNRGAPLYVWECAACGDEREVVVA